MNKYPLIIFVILLIIGIALQKLLNVPIHSLWIMAGLLSILIIISLRFFQDSIVVKNLPLFLIIISVGALHFASNCSKVQYQFHKEKYRRASIQGKIVEIHLLKKEKLTLLIETDYLVLDDSIRNIKIKLISNVYGEGIQLDSLYSIAKIGNKIEANGTIMKPRGVRNPGEFDYSEYLSQQHISAVMNIYKVSDFSIISKEKEHFPALVHEIRRSIDNKISEMNNETTTALLRGLFLADRSLIEYNLIDSFINAGVIHVLAVSGLHVGFLVLIFLVLFARFGLYTKIIFTSFGLILFMIITNSPPSVVRATIMALVILISQLTTRKSNIYNSLSLAACIILFINPTELFNPGFQLSFSAVLAIAILHNRIYELLGGTNTKNKLVKSLLQFVAVSTAAQLGTLPFTLIYFERFSLIALAANFIVIPAIGFVVGIGVITLLSGIFSTSLGLVFASANELLTFLIMSFVNYSGGLEFSFFRVTGFSVFDGILFYIMLGSVFYVIRISKNGFYRIFNTILLIVSFFIFTGFDNKTVYENGKLTIIAIDVGQGDAFLIKFPNGQTALIDSGERTLNFDNGSRIIEPLLYRLGINQIDFAFVSHLDTDHYGGFISLIKTGWIKYLYKPEIDSTSVNDIDFEKLLRKHNVEFSYNNRNVIKVSNARIYVLSNEITKKLSTGNSNKNSGVLKLVYGSNSFLFTGDIDKEMEKVFISQYGGFLKSDLLKLGHHGSGTSSGIEFLKAVSPDYALISAGVENKFKHPNKPTIDRLNSQNIAIFRTDKSGAVIIQSDGYNIHNINWRN